MSYMTVAQAAARLSTSKNDVLRMAKAGVLRSIEKDGQILIDRAAVIARNSSSSKSVRMPRHSGGFDGFYDTF